MGTFYALRAGLTHSLTTIEQSIHPQFLSWWQFTFLICKLNRANLFFFPLSILQLPVHLVPQNQHLYWLISPVLCSFRISAVLPIWTNWKICDLFGRWTLATARLTNCRCACSYRVPGPGIRGRMLLSSSLIHNTREEKRRLQYSHIRCCFCLSCWMTRPQCAQERTRIWFKYIVEQKYKLPFSALPYHDKSQSPVLTSGDLTTEHT